MKRRGFVSIVVPIALVGVFFTDDTRADYLEVRRPANIKSAPKGDASVLMQVKPTTTLLLVKREQSSGYYEVFLPGSTTQTGWVYRTFGRGFPGNPPSLADDDLAVFRDRHLAVGRPQAFFERVHEGYVVGYDGRLKIPAWVQYEITNHEVERSDENRHITRKDDFRPDPTIPAVASATNRDYEEDGDDGDDKADFARGHLAPAADMIRSERVMSDSFLLSNMVPQVGDTFNGAIWGDLESAIRKWTRERDPLVVITGPVFAPEEDGGERVVRYRVIGDSRVAVPTHLFKVVVDLSDQTDPEAIAFLFPNRPYGDDEELDDFLESIDRIETLTGLDLLDQLPDSTEKELEAAPAEQIWAIPSSDD